MFTIKSPLVALAFLAATLTATACGSEPAFVEDRSAKPLVATADAQGKKGQPGEANGAGAGDAINGAADGGADAEDAGATDGDTSGTSSDGGTGGGADAGATDGTPGGKPGNENLDYGDNPDTTLIEDGGKLDLPGEKVERLGINFEDLPNGDFDFNDAVLCFKGYFKVSGSKVVSYREQKIVATTFSASGCSHRIDVRIIHADGTVKTFSYSSKEQKPIEMEFGIKSRLEVTMTPVTNTQYCSNGTTTMHDPTYAKVLLDVCNLSGN